MHFVRQIAKTQKHMRGNVKGGYLTFTLRWQSEERKKEREREGGRDDTEQEEERKAPPDLRAREAN